MADEEVKKPFDLVAGILKEAEQEAARITADADEEAHRRIASAEKRARETRSRQEKEIEQRIEEIQRDAERRAELEIRRIALRDQERLYEAVTSAARKRLEEAIETPGYRDILRGWIVEAAIGLEASSAIVFTSAAEGKYLDQDLLREAEKEVHRLTGRKIELSFTFEEPLTAQGIILSVKGGNRAFNNTVSTRLLRYRTAVHKAIHRELFTEL